jgi:hypothetical protein
VFGVYEQNAWRGRSETVKKIVILSCSIGAAFNQYSKCMAAWAGSGLCAVRMDLNLSTDVDNVWIALNEDTAWQKCTVRKLIYAVEYYPLYCLAHRL